MFVYPLHLQYIVHNNMITTKITMNNHNQERHTAAERRCYLKFVTIFQAVISLEIHHILQVVPAQIVHMIVFVMKMDYVEDVVHYGMIIVITKYIAIAQILRVPVRPIAHQRRLRICVDVE